MDSCDVYMSKNPDQHWFCTTPGINGCTSDLHAYGQCQSGILLNQCNVVLPFTNVDCKQPDHYLRHTFLFHILFVTEFYCRELGGLGLAPWSVCILSNVADANDSPESQERQDHPDFQDSQDGRLLQHGMHERWQLLHRSADGKPCARPSGWF